MAPTNRQLCKALFPALLLILLPLAVAAQNDEDAWPPLNYLRSDYKSVNVVAHIRIREAAVVNRIPGYDNWRIVAEVIEPFKGKLRKGERFEYFHGAEAGIPQKFFAGEKIVFLLAEKDRQTKALKYSVLENSTLDVNEDRLRKLRQVRKSYARKS